MTREREQVRVQRQRRAVLLKHAVDSWKTRVGDSEAMDVERLARLISLPGTRQNFLFENGLPQDYGLHPQDPNKKR